jgi:hypothetical protein
VRKEGRCVVVNLVSEALTGHESSLIV